MIEERKQVPSNVGAQIKTSESLRHENRRRIIESTSRGHEYRTGITRDMKSDSSNGENRTEIIAAMRESIRACSRYMVEEATNRDNGEGNRSCRILALLTLWIEDAISKA